MTDVGRRINDNETRIWKNQFDDLWRFN